MKPRRAKSHKTTPDKPSLISSIADYLVLLLPVSIPILAHGGFVEPRNWQVTLALAVIFVLPVYMDYRSQLPKPSRTEKIFFTLWKWLRRLLAFACVILFLYFIVLVVPNVAASIGEKLLISALLILRPRWSFIKSISRETPSDSTVWLTCAYTLRKGLICSAIIL